MDAKNKPIKVVNTSNNPLPEMATVLSAGMDIRAFVSNPTVLHPMQRKLISTGLYFQIPEGFEVQIRPRSGLALKHGITVLNTPGTIDADYRGEIKVLLINLGTEDFVIQNGERIAQMMLAPVWKITWEPVDELDMTDRGEGGYGSSGKV